MAKTFCLVYAQVHDMAMPAPLLMTTLSSLGPVSYAWSLDMSYGTNKNKSGKYGDITIVYK